ncbi:MAG: ImmA/IrrE family metallo-endopeptidase [Candidatus Aminicenantes bacterium]|nr:ImmA/IrrE family metallo-endopeptidase [Candidatus Aminicenantes bacterium]
MKKRPRRRIFLDPPRLTWEFIREKAEEFRNLYVKPTNLVPVPILEIVESDLQLEVIPIDGLLENIDIDGFLTSDLQRICIDNKLYFDERQENRLRFTFAHEVGHLILHRDEIQKCDFRTPKDWLHFREDFLEEDLNWFEQHAYEFAGRLLVPKNILEEELGHLHSKIESIRRKYTDRDEVIIDAISRIISPKFQVSPAVIQRRIRSEKLWQF